MDRLIGVISPTTDNLSGVLNVYTMETGDGRDIELAFIDGYLCWRRAGDREWIQLCSFSDISSIAPHNSLEGRDAPDTHPIAAISNLQESLDSKVSKESIEALPANNLLIVNSEGSLCDCMPVEDVATKTYLTQQLSSIISDMRYIHNQRTSSALWVIIHNMNKMPSVNVVDSAGSSVIGDVEYINNNELHIRFQSAFSGKAYLN